TIAKMAKKMSAEEIATILELDVEFGRQGLANTERNYRHAIHIRHPEASRRRTPRPRQGAAPYRRHHGWQRPLGAGARQAAHSRPSRRRQERAPHHRRVLSARHRTAHPL